MTLSLKFHSDCIPEMKYSSHFFGFGFEAKVGV